MQILDKKVNMKTIYRILVVIGLLVAIAACNDESRLSPEFEYTGPIPAIADGPSEAQKICYDLYQKYDHNVYYTLSGDEALRTNCLLYTSGIFIKHIFPFFIEVNQVR